MHHRYRRVGAASFSHQEKRKRFPDDHAPAREPPRAHRKFRFRFRSVNADNPAECTGQNQLSSPSASLRHVHRMESIDIFIRIERANDRRFVDLFRVAAIEPEFREPPDPDLVHQRCSSSSACVVSVGNSSFTECKPEVATHFVLRAHISARGRIVSNENNRQPRRSAAFFSTPRFRFVGWCKLFRRSPSGLQ